MVDINSILSDDCFYLIFDHLRASSRLPNHHDLGSAAPIELTLSQVSRRWRDLALSSTALWCRIHCARTPSRYTERTVSRISTYVQRSGSALIDISLICGEMPILLDMVTLLEPHAHRWRSFQISQEWRSNVLYPLHRRLRTLHVPNLIQFSISAFHALSLAESMDPIAEPQIFIHGAPALSIIRLANAAIRYFTPPLTQVTTLRLTCLRGLETYQLLPLTLATLLPTLPILVNLSLEHCLELYGPFPDPQSVQLPNLRSLQTIGVPLQMLQCLSLPRLESLFLFQCPENLPAFGFALPRMTTLRVGWHTRQDAIIDLVLRAAPSLSHVILPSSIGIWDGLGSLLLRDSIHTITTVAPHFGARQLTKFFEEVQTVSGPKTPHSFFFVAFEDFDVDALLVCQKFSALGTIRMVVQPKFMGEPTLVWPPGTLYHFLEDEV